MDTPYLVVDLTRVLDESEPGKAALESLRALLRRAEQEGEALKGDLQKAGDRAARRDAERALLEHRRAVRRELDRRKGALRKALVDLARKVAKDVAAERGVELVLDAAAVVSAPTERDVTDEVIARVDAARPRRR